MLPALSAEWAKQCRQQCGLLKVNCLNIPVAGFGCWNEQMCLVCLLFDTDTACLKTSVEKDKFCGKLEILPKYEKDKNMVEIKRSYI